MELLLCIGETEHLDSSVVVRNRNLVKIIKFALVVGILVSETDSRRSIGNGGQERHFIVCIGIGKLYPGSQRTLSSSS